MKDIKNIKNIERIAIKLQTLYESITNLNSTNMIAIKVIGAHLIQDIAGMLGIEMKETE